MFVFVHDYLLITKVFGLCTWANTRPSTHDITHHIHTTHIIDEYINCMNNWNIITDNSPRTDSGSIYIYMYVYVLYCLRLAYRWCWISMVQYEYATCEWFVYACLFVCQIELRVEGVDLKWKEQGVREIKCCTVYTYAYYGVWSMILYLKVGIRKCKWKIKIDWAKVSWLSANCDSKS